jgi:hypothetical protein
MTKPRIFRGFLLFMQLFHLGLHLCYCDPPFRVDRITPSPDFESQGFFISRAFPLDSHIFGLKIT